MLDINKKDVEFLVTDTMADEARHLIEDLLPQLDDQLGGIPARIGSVHFAACGSSLCAAQTAARLFMKYSALPCSAWSAQDFVDQTPAGIDETTLVVAISDSGATEEVCMAVEKANSRKATTLAIVREHNSPVGTAAQFVLPYRGHSIWTLHLIATYHIADLLISAHGGNSTMREVARQIPLLPGVFSHLVATCESRSRDLGISFSKQAFIYTVSAGNLLPLGYKEGVITLMEFARMHGCFLNAAEFRHGPLEVAEKGVAYMVLVGRDESRATVQRTLAFLQRTNDQVIIFDAQDLGLDLHPELDPMTLFVPLEYFYYWLALAKDHNPDDRRYYGGQAEF